MRLTSDPACRLLKCGSRLVLYFIILKGKCDKEKILLLGYGGGNIKHFA